MRGLRIGITADRKGAELQDALVRRGALVTWGPTLRIVPPEHDELIAAETDELLAARPAYVVVSTATGLAAWLRTLDEERRAAALRMLRHTTLVARGAKAAGGVRANGMSATFVSPRETMDDVADWLLAKVPAKSVVGMQVHGGETVGSLDALRRSGMSIHTVAPYRWALPEDLGPARTLVEEIAESRIDMLACTSAPAVRHLFLLGEQMGRADEMRDALRDRVAAAAIGSITARAFELEGVPVAVMPTRARSGDFVRALAAWAERPDPSTGPLELLPWDRAVRVGPRVVVLGPQQFDVLAALVRRPGVVCKPGTLALEAFGHAMPDDSTAVRHHVSRIRRKLGAYGERIETVRSVGYRYRAS
ncbi:MAG: uroporphyrinogen-III synthase [Actinomycetota bacterium]